MIVLLGGPAIRIWCWLKGSEIIYWLGDGGGRLKLSRNRGFFLANLNANAIRIIRGPFRRRSVIHGIASSYWQIAGEWERELCGQRISLKSSYGLPVETALKLINTYPSLQAMIDRIAELESRPTQLEMQTVKDNLFLANERRQEWSDGVAAILSLTDKDRQRYRSKAAENIRKRLEYLNNWQVAHSEIKPTEQGVRTWENELGHVLP